MLTSHLLSKGLNGAALNGHSNEHDQTTKKRLSFIIDDFIFMRTRAREKRYKTL